MEIGMPIGNFRKNAMKTVATKPAKLGLRVVSKNTARTNIAKATVSLAANTGSLVQALNQYVLGLQLTQEMKDRAFVAMGDVGYDLTILCRVLKCKMPASTKKSKLVGTRTAALLTLNGLATDLLRVVEHGTFDGPKMQKIMKSVVLPNKGGTKEEREVDVVAVPEEAAAEADRQKQMASLLAGAVDTYWRLAYDLFGQPPAVLFADKFKRMEKQYPTIAFDKGEKTKPEAVPA